MTRFICGLLFILLSTPALASTRPDPVVELRRFYSSLGGGSGRLRDLAAARLEKIGAQGVALEWRRLRGTASERVAGSFGRAYSRWKRTGSESRYRERFLRAAYELLGIRCPALASYAFFCAGEVAFALGNYALARQDYDQAERVCPDSVTLHRVLLLEARGAAEQYVGDYESALTDCYRALSLWRQLGYRPGQGVAYNNLGSLYDAMHRYNDSMSCYRRALELVRHSSLPDLSAQVRLNLSEAAIEAGQWQRARRGLSSRAYGPRHALRRVRLLALLEWKLGHNATARRLLRGQLGRTPPSDSSRLDAELLLGRIEAPDSPRQAGRRLEACYRAAQAGGRHDLAWQSAFELSRLDQTQNSLESAVRWAQQALEQLTTASDPRLPATRFRFLSEAPRYLSHLAGLEVRRGRPWQAWRAIEQYRLDRFQQLRAWHQPPLTATRSVSRLDKSFVALFERVAQGQNDPVALSELETAVESQRGQIRVSMGASAASLGRLQSRLARPPATLLQFFPMEENLGIWVINADRTDFFVSPEPVARWKQWAQRLNQEFARPRSSCFVAGDSSVALRAFLYDRLLRPLERLLQPRLWIVPGPVLENLPLEVLLRRQADAAGRDLLVLDRHSVAYLPLAALLQDRADVLPPKPVWQGWYDGDLPAASVEIRRLSASFFDTEGLATNLAADSDLIDRARQAQVLHLATHAIPNEENPMLSYIRLGSGDQQDRRFYVFELFPARLAPRLAVLSACRSGFGIGQGPDVPTSIATAFLSSGVHAMVVNIWDAPDRTEDFFKIFYGYLLSGEDSAEALRQAKRDWIGRVQRQHGQLFRLDHPAYWAGWMAIGRISLEKSFASGHLDLSLGCLVLWFAVQLATRKPRHVWP